jgi:energy-converting hydrogenase Eha subunit A
MKDASDFTWQTHSYINDYIRLGDAKAGALFAVFGVLVGILVTQWADSGDHESWWRVALFMSSMLLALIIMLCSLDVVRPRRRASRPGIIFWEDIVALKAADYARKISEASPEALVEEAALHTYDIARIAKIKFSRLRLAFFLSVPTLVLCFLSIAVL